MSQIITPICEDGVSKPLDRLQLDEHELVRVTFESAPGREAEPLPLTADPLANLRVSTDIPDPAGIGILGCTAKLYSAPRPTIGRLTTSLVGKEQHMRGRRTFSLWAFRQRSIPAAFALLAVQAVCVSLALGQTGQKDAAPQTKAETPASPSNPAQKPRDAGSPSSDSPPTPAWPGQRVWLSELQERNAQAGWGKFGKGGSLGFSDLKITFNGVPAPHGLGMHADASVDYDLAGKYRAFRATPAINDSAGGAGSEVPVVFRVLGDGKVRWESVGMHHSDTAQECLVDITGVKLLTLTVSYDNRRASYHT